MGIGMIRYESAVLRMWVFLDERMGFCAFPRMRMCYCCSKFLAIDFRVHCLFTNARVMDSPA